MSRTIAFIASQWTNGGQRVLPLADRAALYAAGSFGTAPTVYYPPGDVLAREYAVAARCDVRILGELGEIGPFATAWIGAGWLEARGDEFAARLSETYSASLLFDVLKCSGGSDGPRTVVRDAGRGASDLLQVLGPMVLVMSPLAERPAYISWHRRRQARRQIAEEDSLRTAGEVSNRKPNQASVFPAPIAWGPVRPRTRRTESSGEAALEQRMDAAFGVAAARAPTGGKPICADPTICAEHLVRYLAHYGFIRRSDRPSDVWPEAAEVPRRAAEDSVRPERRPDVPSPLDPAILRRPRQSGDPPTRRRRQPRRLVESAGGALSAAILRRPRRVTGGTNRKRGPRPVGESTNSSNPRSARSV
ncbi:MAG: hypothetical protein ACKV0T_27925 [Planctomycetales bacterium]